MPKIAMVVNDFVSMKTTQTTVELAYGLHCRGHEVVVLSVGDLSWGEGDRPGGFGQSISHKCGLGEWLSRIQNGQTQFHELTSFDCIWIRTNPGRDKLRPWAHDVLLDLADWAFKMGVCVLNPVSALRLASSKMFLQRFPIDIRPTSIISRSKAEIVDFVTTQTNPVILKPLRGTGGSGVFKINPNDYDNLNQIIEVLSENDYVIAQAYIPEAEKGDVRLLMLEGEPLMVDGKMATVARLRQGHDLRSNVAAGGKPSCAEVTPQMEWIIEQVSPILKEEGFFFAGLDIIGDKVVEINVFSPGGLRDAAEFAGVDFQSKVLGTLETRLTAF